MINRTEQEIMENWKNDTATPLVSICTITYNHEEFIPEALDSILMQETDFPFEMVVDDDCSRDGTAGVISKYLEKFPTIIKANLREKNIGAMRNFTENMKRAKGKYIALCEGDDYWTDPLKLQKQVEFLEGNDDYIISAHDAFIVDEDGKHLKDSKLHVTQKKDFSGEDLILSKSLILTLSILFRNVIPKEFPKEFYMVSNGDTFLVSLLGHYGKSKYHDDIKPAAYRIHSGGAWSLLSEQEKSDTTLNTFFWIYRYYHRINNDRFAKLSLLNYNEFAIARMKNEFIIKELLNRIYIYSLAPVKKVLRPVKRLFFRNTS